MLDLLQPGDGQARSGVPVQQEPARLGEQPGIGRVPAAEVLISTAYIRDCIENKEKTKFIREQISLGTSQYGMQTFDQSLFQLYKSGLVTLDEALKRATNPDEFRLKLQGVQFTSDVSREQMEESLQIPSEGDLMGGDLTFEIEQNL